MEEKAKELRKEKKEIMGQITTIPEREHEKGSKLELMINFLEQKVFIKKKMSREKVMEVLKHEERNGDWDFKEMYEAVEDIKLKNSIYWKLAEKVNQKLGNEKLVKMKIVHDKRKLLFDKWIKIDKVLKDIQGLKKTGEWVETHGEKALEKIRKRIKGIEKVGIRIENEDKKENKYKEIRKREVEREKKKKEKEEKRKEKEKQKKKQEEEKERVRKEKEEQKNEKERLRKEREKMKKEKEKKRKEEKERIKLEREKQKKEKELMKLKLKEDKKKDILLKKKNSSMMDFFNQTKPNLKRVKTEMSQEKSRFISLGMRRGFGVIDEEAVKNIEMVMNKEPVFKKKDWLSILKSKRQKKESICNPERAIFNRFEDYLGTNVERKGKLYKRSRIVRGRTPLKRDEELVNYDMDTEDELQELEAESCKSRESGDEEDHILDEEDDGEFIIHDENVEEQKLNRKVQEKKMIPKFDDLRKSENKQLETEGWLQMGLRGVTRYRMTDKREQVTRGRFEAVQLYSGNSLINFDFLRRKEILKKKKEEEKMRKKMEKKLEIERNKKKPEITPKEKLLWITETFGKNSKKELIEGGQRLIKHFKSADLENFKEDWKITYFGNIDKFIELFGPEKGSKMYFDCLINKKNRIVYESTIPKKVEKKPSKKKKAENNIVNLFNAMKSESSKNITPQKIQTKRKTRNSKKKKEMDKEKAKLMEKKLQKKDPENMLKLEKIILILGTGSEKKYFDSVIVKSIKKKFDYFSERKILLKAKEVLRFGYLPRTEIIYSLLTQHDNKYLPNEKENITQQKPNIKTMFKIETKANVIPKRIVEDYFFGEKLSEKLKSKFQNEMLEEEYKI